MIPLDSTSSILRARLSGAVATTNPVFVFGYGDEPTDSSTQATHPNAGALNGTTNVTLVGSPASGVSRVVKSGFIYNADSAAVTIIVEYYDGTTARQIGKHTVNSGSTLVFGDSGFTSGGGGSAAVWGAITGTLTDQTDLAADLLIAQAQLVGINDQTGTTYTLVLGDAGKDVRCNNSSAITLTVPPNSSVAFPIGTLIAFSQKGVGNVTATAGSGVTVNAANGAATGAQYDRRVLEKTDSDTWAVW